MGPEQEERLNTIRKNKKEMDEYIVRCKITKGRALFCLSFIYLFSFFFILMFGALFVVIGDMLAKNISPLGGFSSLPYFSIDTSLPFYIRVTPYGISLAITMTCVLMSFALLYKIAISIIKIFYLSRGSKYISLRAAKSLKRLTQEALLMWDEFLF